jgi:putative endonuclease
MGASYNGRRRSRTAGCIVRRSASSRSRAAGPKPKHNMYYVYLLQDKDGKLYIGYSTDLKRRIGEHTSGKVYTSSRMDQPRLVYYESYNEEVLAKEREKKLKQFGSSYVGLLKRLGIR